MCRTAPLIALLCLAAAPMGDVSITIVAPDGHPAAGATVHVSEVDQHHFPDDPAPAPAVATADGAGVAHVRWPAGATRLHVTADGVGYGWTGLLEVVADESIAAPLPPLAAYATVAGTVPRAVLKPGTTVTLAWVYGESPVVVPVDLAGRFVATVPGGPWWVSASVDKKRVAQLDRPIRVECGQRLTGVALAALTPEQHREWTGHRSMRERPAEAVVTWAEGTVRDAQGRPIAGATVYAAAIYHGGLRMYEQAAAATTDATGHYAIRGKGGLSMFSATLVAAAPGHPPAFDAVTLPSPGYAELPEGATQPATQFPTPPAPTRDFVLADHGGGLDVVAAVDGRPAALATVGLWRDGGNLRDEWAAGSGSPEQKAAEQLAYPTATAGPDGIAHFADLVPGTYQIVATVAGGQQRVAALHQNTFPSEVPQPYAIADGVAVRTGETVRQTVTLFPQPNTVALRLLRADGSPMTDRPAFDWGRAVGGGGWSSGTDVGPDGVARHTFEAVGLWRVSAKHHHGPTKVVPLTPPYFAADGVVAVSSLLALRGPTTIRAVWQEPAAIDVDVRDAAGRPAAGTVAITTGMGDPFQIATVDPAGRARFHGVRRWDNDRIAVRLSADPLPDLGGQSGGTDPLPADAALRGHAFIPMMPIDARPLDQIHRTLAAVPAGYVRGRLIAPPGHSAGDYAIYLREADDRGAVVDLRRDTGEFVAGPFPAGPLTLRVFRAAGWSAGPLAELPVVVRGGDVVTATVSPPPPPTGDGPAGGEVLITVGGAQRSPADVADVWVGRSVVLADGVTPAYGAQVVLVEPERAEPTAAAAVDVAGRLHGRNGWQSAMAQPADPPGSPSVPVLVAWLPGAVGASVVSPSDAIKIVLPPAVSARGMVTVGGRPPVGLQGRVRVFAAHQGHGKVDRWLSVWATPQDDGTFELAGLTPGAYRVQAAVDGIWLSAAQSLTVGNSVGPITLNVPALGGPVAVHVTDAAGRPAVDMAVTIDRPTGPLTDAYWPAEGFTTDGAGVAVLPALEAGRHIAQVAGRSVEVIAPALPCDRPTRVDVRVP